MTLAFYMMLATALFWLIGWPKIAIGFALFWCVTLLFLWPLVGLIFGGMAYAIHHADTDSRARDAQDARAIRALGFTPPGGDA